MVTIHQFVLYLNCNLRRVVCVICLYQFLIREYLYELRNRPVSYGNRDCDDESLDQVFCSLLYGDLIVSG